MDYFDYDGVAAEFETGSDSWDIQSFLEESQERSQELLENELERIEDELEERDRIHSERWRSWSRSSTGTSNG